MNLGYACINTELKGKFRTCRLDTFRKEGIFKIKELTLANLNLTYRILLWNKAENIKFYRLSSDIVPFASHEEMTWEWCNDSDVLAVTDSIKKLAQQNNMRLTCHPGQYTIINSPKDKVVQDSICELEYHAKLMDLVGGSDMVLHIGGVYGNKELAMQRFIDNYKMLSNAVKTYLIIENDDKSFTVEDVLYVSKATDCPVVVDLHHHRVNPSIDIKDAMGAIVGTWNGKRKPKIHISSGKTGIADRSHHDYILEEDWKDYRAIIGEYDVDVMIEAKLKEQALLKVREM